MIPEVCRFLRHDVRPRQVGDLVGLFCDVDGIWFPPEPIATPRLDAAPGAPARTHSPLGLGRRSRQSAVAAGAAR